MNLAVSTAQSYTDKLSEDSKNSAQRTAEQGYLPRDSPIGYKNIRVRKKGVKGTRSRTIVDETRAHLVRKAFELYSTGQYSIEQITNIMNQEGLTQKTSPYEVVDEHKPVTSDIINRMLRNLFYCGYINHAGKLFPSESQSLISIDTFDKCQDVLNKRQNKSNRSSSDDSITLYSNLIRCYSCNAIYSPDSTKKTTKTKEGTKVKIYHYLKTKGYDKNRARAGNIKICYNCWSASSIKQLDQDAEKTHKAIGIASNVKKNLIDYQVYKILQSLKISQKFINKHTENSTTSKLINKEIHGTEYIVNLKREDLLTLQMQKDKLKDLIKNNNRLEQERKDASKECREVVRKINLLEEEILILDRKLIHARDILEKEKNKKDNNLLQSLNNDLVNYYHHADLEDKRLILNAIFEEMKLDGLRLRVKIKYPFKLFTSKYHNEELDSLVNDDEIKKHLLTKKG